MSKLPSAASFYVPSLPGLKSNPSWPLHIFAGHLPSDPNEPPPSKDITAHLYFVLTRARKIADRERLIIWFNGGPGCSSFDGLMMEVGPWRMDRKGGLKTIEGGWEEYAHVLYIDQPPGTGFSYVSTDKYIHELDEASQHLIQFLKNFYAVFPEFTGMDTYLAGESFAGQYIPYFVNALLKTTRVTVPLRGAAIGNGWIDPRTQYPAYIDFALQYGILKNGSKELTKSQAALEKCMKQINATSPLPPSLGDCEVVMSVVIEHMNSKVNGKDMCMNVYDIRLTDESPACGLNWPPDLPFVNTYLRRQDVVQALHATAHKEAWIECNTQVGAHLRNRKSPASIVLFPEILKKVPMLLFAGDQDYICNHVGMEKLVDNLQWNGGRGFGTIKPQKWFVNGTAAGEWTSARNLTYVKVKDASHMVGFDVPMVAQDMMLRFMGVDLASLARGSASVPSRVGNDIKPVVNISLATTALPTSTKTSDKANQAKWEAFYNAGSAALLLVIIALGVGLYFFFRARRNKRMRLPMDRQDAEESIALTRADGNGHLDDEDMGSHRDKGKGREVVGHSETKEEAIFEVGDSDDEEEEYKDRP